MRFAAFTTVAGSAGEAATADAFIDNLRQQTILAEELGFEAMWLGEHHFGPYGLGDLPNPILLGADLAARTSKSRIGQMANIAPWWHPIRLAEDLAILDNMTGGRVDVGFGRGIWPYEGPQFHPNADPRKDRENRELFNEMVEIVRKIWTNEYFSYHGTNYSFPAEDTAFSHPRYPSNPAWQDGERVTKLRVTPRPYQKPHPPLWMTVSTDRSVSTAAELGLKACYWQPPPSESGSAWNSTPGSGQSWKGDTSVWEKTRRSCAPRMWPLQWRRRAGMPKKASCPHSSSTIHFAAGKSSLTRTRSWHLK